jgi:hypothetical protein
MSDRDGVLRAVHLSWASDAAKTLLSLLEAGIEPVPVNSHPTLGFERVSAGGRCVPVEYDLHARLRMPLARYLRYGFALAPPLASAAVRVSRLRSDLRELRDRIGRVDFIFAHWGTGVTPELALLKRSAPFRDVPVILNMETFPTAWRSGLRETLELRLLRRAAPYVDATLIPTREMAQLLARSVPELLERPHRVEPFYFPRVFQQGEQEPEIPADDEHDVIFTGWFDFTRTLNDVRAQLRSLADVGLTVHCSVVEGMDHPNVRLFERFGAEAFTSGVLAAFMRRFKASLVTYDFGGPGPPALRFSTSTPSRLLFTQAAGVPVLLPKGRFPPMERVVGECGTGFAYDSPESAFRRLRSSDWPAVQERAYAERGRFLFDARGFRRFVRESLGLGGRSTDACTAERTLPFPEP